MIIAIILLSMGCVLAVGACIALLMRSQKRDETEMEEMRRQTRLEFEALSAKVLANQKNQLQAENAERLGNILTPLRIQIEEFSKAVNDSYVKENASRQSLSDQIERLAMLNQTISAEARNLSEALRGNSKVQGDWGETILETLLEQAGLKRDINYTLQLTQDEGGSALRDDEGNLRRPDVVVHLPADRKIIIDSKVSLKSYLEFTEAADNEQREAAALRVAYSMRRHVDELALKKYQKIVKNSAEHVLMFVPNEGAYFAAIGADPSLWQYAFERRVVIVSPTHLFSVMQLVEQIWRGEKQNRNAAEIARLGGLIYDKVATFSHDFESIQKGLQSTEAAWEKCLRHLTSGNTSIIARTRRMRELGAKATKHLATGVEDSANLLSSESGSLEE